MQYKARTQGETRTHIYDNSMGYPIRVCNWSMPEKDFIENGDAPLCKYCQAYRDGTRKICGSPDIAHPEKTCPKCGNDKVMILEELESK